MADLITVTGVVATEPKHLITGTQLPITSFRLASSQRRFDRSKQEWVDGDTNWYSVSAFRQLALNTVGSVHKGERVIVTGRLRIRPWENEEKSGTTIEIDADSLGHDLNWGTSSFERRVLGGGGDSPVSTVTVPGVFESDLEHGASDVGEAGSSGPDECRPATLISEPADELTTPF